jgi:hypothetical protein
MADPSAHDAFFVGYSKKVPRRLAMFLGGVAAATSSGFAVTGLALGVAVDDPGDGDYLRPQKLVGVIQVQPYPVLRLRSDAPGGAARTLMLSGGGKHGAQAAAAPMDGKLVEASGTILKRGPLEMLQLDGDASLRLVAEGAGFRPTPPVALGRWRLAGEICDGKCYAGAMRPGRGLAHKACANLCLTGGVPAVFVSSGQVDGGSFFLLADRDGRPVAPARHELVAVGVELEGQVERLDDLLVFRADLGRARML